MCGSESLGVLEPRIGAGASVVDRRSPQDARSSSRGTRTQDPRTLSSLFPRRVWSRGASVLEPRLEDGASSLDGDARDFLAGSRGRLASPLAREASRGRSGGLEKLVGEASCGRSDGLEKEVSSGGLAIAYAEARLGASPPWAPCSCSPSVTLPSARRAS